jgi:outer membrane protein TolC
MTLRRFFPVLVVLTSGFAANATAQERWGTDTLTLRTMQQLAAAADPRTRELALHEQAANYRVRNIAAERLPAFSLETQSQYQSDVVTFGLNLPNAPRPPKDTYDAFLRIQQSVLDATNQPRRGLERAQLVESQARVHSAPFALRQEVNTAYFSAAQLQERAAELAIVIGDLEARLEEANVRVRGGTALPSEPAAIQATLLQRRQDELEVRANRRAALEVLATLTSRSLPDSVVLGIPQLAATVTRTRATLADVRARPEYAQFASTRARLQAQERVVSAQQRPRVSAYARAGYGKPGLKVLPDEWDSYWLVGLQTQWRPFTWGSAQRERESLEAQREIAQAEEAAFTRDVQRAIQRDLATLDRVEAVLALDDQIVALRERIERETRVRFEERVLMAAEYLDRRSDVLEARLARARHRVELAQAQAQFLTTLGLEVQ